VAARIEDYAVLGDLRTAALVSRDGAVDWWCPPRFDSAACFAALLGTEQDGCWTLRPTDNAESRRRYRPDTLVLETDWRTTTGEVRVVDFLSLPDGDLRPEGNPTRLVRMVTGVRGRVEMCTVLRARFDYGRIEPWVEPAGHGTSIAAGADALHLDTRVTLTAVDGVLSANFAVEARDEVSFVLAHQARELPPPESVDPADALARTDRTWRDWIGRSTYDGRWREQVHRSLLTLKALTYAPTGGIIAAATTSLPEQIGGVRNWDYRYCWLRDSTFTLKALLNAGFHAEANEWREWLLRAVAGDPADLQVAYAVDGSRRMEEQNLDWLCGFEDSRPVRAGNGAAGQYQLDVRGEVLDGLYVAREDGIAAEDDAWGLQRDLLDYLEGNWQRPDQGIWEIRGTPREFVHSKVMAWAGLDRGVRAVEDRGLPGDAKRWREARDEIHAEVCARGYDPTRNTFTQFYGSRGLDAALLLVPRTGFLPWSDPRILGTLDAVRRELDCDGLLLRYDPECDGGIDGLPPGEGAFLAANFWLVEALVGAGRVREAEALFERLLTTANDLGLLSEEYDPVAERQLGNTPQGFSHVGLVNAARTLSEVTG
jgi:GH15 family glucan-1,4-alpha-glucosidase